MTSNTYLIIGIVVLYCGFISLSVYHDIRRYKKFNDNVNDLYEKVLRNMAILEKKLQKLEKAITDIKNEKYFGGGDR